MADAERWTDLMHEVDGALEEIRAAFEEAYPEFGEEIAEAIAEAVNQTINDVVSEEFPEYIEAFEDFMEWQGR